MPTPSSSAASGLHVRLVPVVPLDVVVIVVGLPKVRIMVPGLESRWMTWVTEPVRKNSSA